MLPAETAFIRVALMLVDTEVTCQNCPINDTCEFAFDPYNTDGDCLAEK